MPFRESNFDGIICVGSVINYCDANAVIAEFSRVAKPNSILILEFESSAGKETQVCHFQIFLGNLEKYLPKKAVYMVS